MYSPALVLPYQRVPGQWYTLLAVLSQTFPAPPPLAAGVEVASLFDAFEGADVEVVAADDGFADEVLAYHSFTPLWPLHAPLFDAAVVYVPSPQTPVDPAGALAGACARQRDDARRQNNNARVKILMVPPVQLLAQ